MNKGEFISAVSAKLHESKAKKPVTVPKHKFFITDEDGSQSSVTVQPQDKMVGYTVGDVRYIVDAIIEVAKDAMRTGEEISIYGFGVLKLYYRAPRRTKTAKAGGGYEWFDVEERYVPKFIYGSELRNAAKAYNLILKEKKAAGEDVPEPVYDEYDDMEFMGEYMDHAED